MYSQKKWQEIIHPILLGTPVELVGVEQVGGGKYTIVRIYIDKPGGITIDDIAQLSREISVVLKVEQPIKGDYTLEVSSPGLARPLFLPAHFKQQIGKKIAVKMRIAWGDRHNFKGILQQANDEGVELEVDGQRCTLVYGDIEKAKVIPHIEIGRGLSEPKK